MHVSGGVYFFTVVTHRRRQIVAQPENISLLQTAIASVQARRPFAINAQVILPEHVHCIWTLPEGDSDFSSRWMTIKSNFVRSFRRRHDSAEPVLQGRFWEHLIRDERDYVAHVEYIHYNPVQHGYVAAPRDWPHSSFHEFVARGDYYASWGYDEPPKQLISPPE